jgi:hypothetical protein
MPIDHLPDEWPRAQLEQILQRAGMSARFENDSVAHLCASSAEGEPLPVTLWATVGALRLQALLTPMPALPEALAPLLNDSAIDGPWASLAFRRGLGLVANIDLYLYPTTVPAGSSLRSAVRYLADLRDASVAGRPAPLLRRASEVEAPTLDEETVLSAFGAILGPLSVEPDRSRTARVDYGEEGRWTMRLCFEEHGPVLDALLDSPPAWTRSGASRRHLAELNGDLAAGALSWWEGGHVVWRRRIAAAHETADAHWAKLILDQACNANALLHRDEP